MKKSMNKFGKNGAKGGGVVKKGSTSVMTPTTAMFNKKGK